MKAKDADLSTKIVDLKVIVNTTCPSGWINKEEIGCFYFGTTEMTWQEAQNYCKSMNAWADLAEIHNAETDTFIHDTVKEKSAGYWWIGGSDKNEVIPIYNLSYLFSISN